MSSCEEHAVDLGLIPSRDRLNEKLLALKVLFHDELILDQVTKQEVFALVKTVFGFSKLGASTALKVATAYKVSNNSPKTVLADTRVFQ